jgi:AraC-like DNA-binding protein
MNQCALSHCAGNLPLKDSMNALSVGYPGREKSSVTPAQELVHMRAGRGLSLASMAATSGLERRTFLRRFSSAMGMTPLEYCRTVRIARARELLVRERPAKGDRPIPRLQGRGFMCPHFSQGYGIAPANPHRRCRAVGSVIDHVSTFPAAFALAAGR